MSKPLPQRNEPEPTYLRELVRGVEVASQYQRSIQIRGADARCLSPAHAREIARALLVAAANAEGPEREGIAA